MTDEPAAPYRWFSVWEHETDAYEPPLTGACAAFAARLRELVPVWHELKLRHGDTSAFHDAGRVWAVVDLRDRVTYAELRVEVTDTSWAAAWVEDPSHYVRDLADAGPRHQTGGDTDIVGSAVGWLRAQLELPITYREWRHYDKVVAYNWAVDGVGRVLYQFETPPRRRRARPDVVRQVRP